MPVVKFPLAATKEMEASDDGGFQVTVSQYVCMKPNNCNVPYAVSAPRPTGPTGLTGPD